MVDETSDSGLLTRFIAASVRPGQRGELWIRGLAAMGSAQVRLSTKHITTMSWYGIFVLIRKNDIAVEGRVAELLSGTL